jgi:YegS/Rv2252/BmrU family lipid kinase
MSSTHAVRACLITNPKSGKGGIDLSPVLPILAAHGWQAEVRQKLHGGHATELAAEAVKDGFDVVVACGGDGTVGEVVEGVLGSTVAVGVLPGGTANLWAHEIGVSMDLAEATLQLIGAQRRAVDVGRIAINGDHAQCFLLMAGLGVDAAVLNQLSKPLKNKVGMLAYLPAIGRALPKAKPFTAKLDLDGVSREAEAVQIVIGNTRRYASVTSVTPEALVDDGKLDVCVLAPAHAISAAHQLSSLVLRKRPSPISAVNDRVGLLTVRTTEVIPLQADGGRVKQKKVKAGNDGVLYEFSVRANELTVLVPRDYTGDLFQSGGPSEAQSQTSAQKEGKSWYRVKTIGVDTISAIRKKDGSVITVELGPKARYHDGEGTRVSRSQFLAGLGEGQSIQIKGKMGKRKRRISARKLRR